VANEAIVNIRTVASLTKEPKFVDDYKDLIAVPYQYVLWTSVCYTCITFVMVLMKLDLCYFLEVIVEVIALNRAVTE